MGCGTFSAYIHYRLQNKNATGGSLAHLHQLVVLTIAGAIEGRISLFYRFPLWDPFQDTTDNMDT